MGLEVVLNEILGRGSEEEQRILREAEAEARRILEQARSEADANRTRIRRETNARRQALEREQRSAAEFEARRHELTAHRLLTEDFRRRLLEALGDLPRAERAKLLDRLAQRALKEIPGGRIHANKADLAHLQKATPYAKGRDLACVGGFQVESEDGSLVLDYRFETLLEAAWRDILATTQALFQG